MIKNERQFRITKAQADRFERDLATFAAQQANPKEMHPLLWKAHQDALRSQLEDLRAELDEYEALQSGRLSVLQVESFADFPRALIRARIAAGLSQKELADRLGMKEQQLQRYEATDYGAASLDRIAEVIQALGLRVRKDIFLPGAQLTPSVFFKRLDELGLPRQFVLKRLLPPALSERLQSRAKKEENGQLVLRAAAMVSRVLDIPTASFFGAEPLQLNVEALGGMRFKKTTQANQKRLSAYTVYAHHLALLLLEATPSLPVRPVPTDPYLVRETITREYGGLTFANALRYAWDLGIPVLPLNDSGAFHGACWRVNWRNVIVVKQQTISLARWLFDLLHEFEHAGEEPEKSELSIVEETPIQSRREQTPEEEHANDFAGTVMLDGRAEELVNKCVEAARGSVEHLKSAVPRVAQQEGVALDVLANYVAYRLSLQNLNWWGVANGFQGSDGNAWQVARDILIERADLSLLNAADRQLLQQALSEDV